MSPRRFSIGGLCSNNEIARRHVKTPVAQQCDRRFSLALYCNCNVKSVVVTLPAVTSTLVGVDVL